MIGKRSLLSLAVRGSKREVDDLADSTKHERLSNDTSANWEKGGGDRPTGCLSGSASASDDEGVVI